MTRFLLTFFGLFLIVPAVTAQELNCTVDVQSPQIQGTMEKQVFESLKKAAFEFMNNTKWTNDVFSPEERIVCNLQFTFSTKVSDNEYSGTLQIISTRTAFKSSFSSPVLNYNDPDIDITYVQFQPMEFSINQDLSNLTSILAYYAYVIIAMDYDTYALNGGTPYWLKAQQIVNNAQNAPEKGWKSGEGTKNRYWFVDDMLQSTFAPVRECLYKYHRLGFDVMYQDVTGGRAAVLDALNLLQSVHESRPLSYPLQVFFNAKFAEIISLFQGGTAEEKTKALALLQKIDPGHGVKYQAITQNQ